MRRQFEWAYIPPMFDWQNLVFLIFIMLCIASAKWIFKRTYEYSHAQSYTDKMPGRGTSMKFMVGMDVPETQGAAAAGPQKWSAPTGGGAQAGTGYGGAEEGTAGGAEASKVDQEGVALQFRGTETHWETSLKNPAVLICLSAYLFAITSICVSSITEFVDPSDPSHTDHVGWDTQSTGKGVTARFENIGSSIVWQAIGVVLMSIAQWNLRLVIFRNVDNVGEVTGMTQEAHDAGHGGRNIAAAIVEAGAVVSAGLVSAANIGGAPKAWGEDIASTCLYFVLSQIGFVIYTEIFDFFYIKGDISTAVKEELSEEHEITMPHGEPNLKRGNVAVAISYACTMVSFAMLISNAVWKSYELANFGVWFALGGALQLLFRFALDHLVAWGRGLDEALDEKKNWGFACVIGAMQLSISRVLASLMEDSCAGFQYTEGPGTEDIAEASALCASLQSGSDGWGAPLCEENVEVTNLTSGEPVLTPLGCALVHDECTAFVWAKDLSLGDALTQTQQMKELFKVQHLLALGILLTIMWLSKFTFQFNHWFRLKIWQEGDQFQLMTQICEHGNSAIAISLSAYLFSVGTMLSGLFRDLRQLGVQADAVEELLTDAEEGGVTQFTTDLAWVGIGFAMLLVTQMLNDYIVFHKCECPAASSLNADLSPSGDVSTATNMASF